MSLQEAEQGVGCGRGRPPHNAYAPAMARRGSKV
jgi:hypothetical protein